MPQLQAGYYLEFVKNALSKHFASEKDKVEGLYYALSFFELDTSNSIQINNDNIDSVVAVANNLISRGLPTKTPLNIENQIAEAFDVSGIAQDDLGAIKFKDAKFNEKSLELLFNSLHIIDPRINLETQLTAYDLKYKDYFGSDAEKVFYFNHLPRYFGKYITQIIEPQRYFESILSYSQKPKEEIKSYLNRNFLNILEKFDIQKVDFALEYPYFIEDSKGIVIEIDGRQHLDEQQKFLDFERDNAVKTANWNTLRIATSEFKTIQNKLSVFDSLRTSSYFSILKNNYEKNILNSSINELQLTLSPIAIARIQKVLIQYILAGKLNLNATFWNICVIERDVPCATLAVQNLVELLDNLFLLEGKGKKTPIINLEIYISDEFKNAKLRKFDKQFDLIDNIQTQQIFDLYIDISVLRRKGFELIKENVKTKEKAVIRSAHSVKSKTEFITTSSIEYLSLGDFKDENFTPIDDRIPILEYFLQNIFRKNKFRDGQLPILNRALQNKSVIGLLPTGGGKSLTYQLAAMLQPGITMVIDPIKSLMKDQYEGLRKNGIDASVVINSSLKTLDARKTAIDKLTNANVLFCFVSPERLQIPEFRTALAEMKSKKNTYFSYCVVDEAHCVSEWGHDFRTSYLRLGENARKHCKNKIAQDITLFGLTATASFDVLTDVQREINIGDEGIIRSKDPTSRPELFYNVIKVETSDIIGTNDFQIKQEVGLRKQIELVKILKNLPYELQSKITEYDDNFSPKNFNQNTFFKIDENEYNHAGLIFCPYKSIRTNSGVDNVVSNLKKENKELKIGYFYGTGNDDDSTPQDEIITEQHQTDFIENKINLLVATKAFGLGIDKPNIRYTVHFNYPSSIEGFVQESGRAGRDNKIALNYILYSSNPESDREILQSFFNNAFRGRAKEVNTLFELLTEITFPTEFNVSLNYTVLVKSIFLNFGNEVEINPSPSINPTKIYINNVNIPNIANGYIDLLNWEIKVIPSAKDKVFSEKLLNYILEYFNAGNVNKDNIYNWLFKPDNEGIQLKLNKMKVGDETELIIGFRNGKLNRILKVLQQIDERFTINIIESASNFCHNVETYIKNLSKEFSKSFGEHCHIPTDSESEIKKLFTKIRDKQDSEKAIYRLSLIGVIDDYSVDYNSKTFLVSISKKLDIDYITKLKQYYIRYISLERTEFEIEKLYSRITTNNTIIEKCLASLTDFVYNEIVNKREQAMRAMEYACDIGKDGEKMREFIYLYNNAQYLRDYEINGKNYNLNIDTDRGKDFSLDVLIKYIDVTEGKVNNLKHLLGSSVRLLTEHPKNGTLLLLKSFALFLLNITDIGEIKSQKHIQEAESIFLEGLSIFSNQKKQFDEVIDGFKTRLIAYNSSITPIIESIIETLDIKQHLDWLKSFNTKFLKRYER